MEEVEGTAEVDEGCAEVDGRSWVLVEEGEA